MPLVTRSQKGLPLTHVEMDNNFISLDEKIDNLFPYTQKFRTPLFDVPSLQNGKKIKVLEVDFSTFYDSLVSGDSVTLNFVAKHFFADTDWGGSKFTSYLGFFKNQFRLTFDGSTFSIFNFGDNEGWYCDNSSVSYDSVTKKVSLNLAMSYNDTTIVGVKYALEFEFMDDFVTRFNPTIPATFDIV